MSLDKEKKQFIISLITIFVLFLIIVMLIIMYFQMSFEIKEKTFEDSAKEFCNQRYVSSVSICNDKVIEIRLNLVNGETRFIHLDGTTFSCPAILLETMSRECKIIFNALQNGQWNCIKVC